MQRLPKNTPRRRTTYRKRPTRFSTRQIGVCNETQDMRLLLQIDELQEALQIADEVNKRLVLRALTAEKRRIELERIVYESQDGLNVMPRRPE